MPADYFVHIGLARRALETKAQFYKPKKSIIVFLVFIN